MGVTINLQCISDILSSLRVWSFALVADSSTHQFVSYLDIRICICPNGSLENLHPIAMPFYDRRTIKNIAAMICRIMDVLYACWQSKIIDFNTDGENTMIRRHAGVVTWIDHASETKLMRIWCVPHQIDLIVKDVNHSLDDGLFYKTAHNFSVHLRRQQNLQLKMGSTCPKNTNRWVHLECMLSWMLEHRHRLLIWTEDSWWLVTAGVRPLLELINVTLVILQSLDIILS
jgi:hypothetical protein